MPANPGNKTDETDLHAQHRAAIAGFGLREHELESPYRELQLRVRHRRKLVEKAAALVNQIREHLHLSMPSYASLWDDLLLSQSALAIARRCESPAKVIKLGRNRLGKHLSKCGIRFQWRTVDKILTWAAQATDDPIEDGPLHHAIWTDLEELYQHFHQRIAVLEKDLAHDLVQTPYVRLLAIPGINVVSAADLAGEMGPMNQYANANAITGRAGLYPSRHQSDQTDLDNGPIVRQANRRLRCILMRIADLLACHCHYYRAQAELDQARGVDKRASRVKIAKRFSRLAMACVSSDQPMKHECFKSPDSIIEKLRRFHHDHQTPLDVVMADLETTVQQLPYKTCGYEAEVVAEVLENNSNRKRGTIAIGELLPTVLARLNIRLDSKEKKGRS